MTESKRLVLMKPGGFLVKLHFHEGEDELDVKKKALRCNGAEVQVRLIIWPLKIQMSEILLVKIDL